MALNQWMHPRNRYREARPDFKMLAEKYANFREHTRTDSKGKVTVTLSIIIRVFTRSIRQMATPLYNGFHLVHG